MPAGRRKRSNSSEKGLEQDEPRIKINVIKDIQEPYESAGLFQSESVTHATSAQHAHYQSQKLFEHYATILIFLGNLKDSSGNEFISTVWHHLHTNNRDPEKLLQSDLNHIIFAVLSVFLKKMANKSEDAESAKNCLIAAKKFDQISNYYGFQYRVSTINFGTTVCFKYIKVLYNLIEGQKHLLEGKAVKFCINRKACIIVDYEEMFDTFINLFTNGIMLESTYNKPGISVSSLNYCNILHLKLTGEFVKEIAKVTLDGSDKNILFALTDDINEIVTIAQDKNYIIKIFEDENDAVNIVENEIAVLPPYTAQPVHVIYK